MVALMVVYTNNFVTCRRTVDRLSAVQCKNCFVETKCKANGSLYFKGEKA